jgi:hypothetical protein
MVLVLIQLLRYMRCLKNGAGGGQPPGYLVQVLGYIYMIVGTGYNEGGGGGHGAGGGQPPGYLVKALGYIYMIVGAGYHEGGVEDMGLEEASLLDTWYRSCDTFI